MSRQRCTGRRGPREPRIGTASSTSLIMAASGTFAPLIRAAIGTPRPSVKMWRFTPLFARSVGFGPVRSPLLAPSQRRYRVNSISKKFLDGHRNTSAAHGGSTRTRRAGPSAESASGRSSQSRNRSAALSTDNPFSVDTGSRPSRFGMRQEGVRLSACRAPAGLAVRFDATARRAHLQTWLPRTAVDHTRSTLSRGFRIGSKPRARARALPTETNLPECSISADRLRVYQG